jgi:LuxR family transcriptional regulator, maltose regulon positive regulatory protein
MRASGGWRKLSSAGKLPRMTKAVAVTTINAASGEQVERAYGLLMSDAATAQTAFSDAWGALEPLNANGSRVDLVSSAHLACAGALTAYFTSWSNFAGMKTWLARLAGLPAHTWRDPLDELRYIGGQLCASRLAEDSTFANIDVEANFARAILILQRSLPVMDFAQALIQTPVLFECCQVLRHRAEAHELERLLTRDERFASVPPLWQGRWWDWLAAAYFVLDDRPASERCEAEAKRIADEHSIALLQFELRKKPLRYLIEAGKLGDAEKMLGEMYELFNPAHLAHSVEYWDMQGRLKLARREFSAAQDAYRRALAACEAGEMPRQSRVVLWSMSGAVQIAMGHEEPALALFQRMVDVSSGTQREIMTCSLHMTRAYFAWKEGRDGALDLMTKALREAARLNLLRFMRPLPEHAAEMCHAALEMGIETDFAKRVIAGRSLAAPALCTSAWPSALKIFTAGSLRIEIDGAPLPPQAKPSVKPMSLVKLIAAHEGEPIPVASAVSMLWPDGDGDRASFDMALGRLKKLLGRDDLIYLEGGQLVADPAKVWIDSRHGLTLSRAIERACREGATTGTLMRLSSRLMRIHVAPFLQHEDTDAWIIAARVRDQQRFLRGVDQLGAAFEDRGAAGHAQQLYEKAIEVEPLAESLYRRLMLCHRDGGSPAEAIRVYRRLRQMLSVMLGLPPSKETETLMREIHGTPGKPGLS